MTVDHEFKGSAISLCCEICGEGRSYHKNNYCPQCARFREKLDREKMAIALCGGEEVWAMLKENARAGYLNDCDVLIKYLTE